MTGHPFLRLGFEPLRMEVERDALTLEGDLPADLAGTFLRIGPNPQFPPREPYNPLNGDGMIHRFEIGGGRVSYRNRWVRTETWKRENAAGRALFGTSGAPTDRDPSVLGALVNGAANTNLVFHAGRLLALEEGHGPIEVDPASLDTIGPYTFGGRLPRNMTAHPKVDPVTGEMLLIANFEDVRRGEELGLHVVDAGGALVRSERIKGPYPAIVHDFAITRDFVVVIVCPATVSMQRIMAGGSPIAWEPERAAHLGVMPRAGSAADVRWWTAPACMVWHMMNAFNEGGRITVDLCQQDAAMFPLADGTPPDEARAAQKLARWTLDWDAPGEVGIEVLWDGPCEYPRIDERLTGRPHRYGYLACDGGPGSGDLFQRGLARFEFATGALDRWTAGPGFAVGEPVFCPAAGATAEDDGYILTTVFDEGRGDSCLAIFRAGALQAGPVARAQVGHRVPMGFHATWLTPG
jgi:carotenoid cleavage dioxygenase-like enzyme